MKEQYFDKVLLNNEMVTNHPDQRKTKEKQCFDKAMTKFKLVFKGPYVLQAAVAPQVWKANTIVSNISLVHLISK